MSATVFLAVFLTSIGSYAVFGWWMERKSRAAVVKRVVAKPSNQSGSRRPGPALMQVVDEVRGKLASGLLDRLRLKASTEQLLDRADVKWGAVGLIHRMVGFFLAGFATATLVSGNRAPAVALAVASVGALLPLLYIRRVARRRARRFEEQFPDCLEFISRSMRAGHAFSVSLEL